MIPMLRPRQHGSATLWQPGTPTIWTLSMPPPYSGSGWKGAAGEYKKQNAPEGEGGIPRQVAEQKKDMAEARHVLLLFPGISGYPVSERKTPNKAMSRTSSTASSIVWKSCVGFSDW